MFLFPQGKAFAYTSVQTPYHSYTTSFNTNHGNFYTQFTSIPHKTISNHLIPFVQSEPAIRPIPFQTHPAPATQHVETPFHRFKTYGYKPANVNLPLKSFSTRPVQGNQLKSINKPNRIPIPVKTVTARPVQIKKSFTRPAQVSQLKPTKKLIPVTGNKI